MRLSLKIPMTSLALFLSACASQTPSLIVPKASILSGTETAIQAKGFKPNSKINIVATRIRQGLSGAEKYCSAAEFITSSDGRVDTATMPALTGSYTGTDPFGLFWSMKKCGEVDAYSPEVVVTVDRDLDEQIDLSASFQMVDGHSSLIEESFDENFPGAFVVRPSSDAPLPAIFILGGSEGGDFAARILAPKFASQGYVAIGLPYYSPAWGEQPQAIPGLPKAFAEIPVEYLLDASSKLNAFEHIESGKIAVFGASKGAELALIAASKSDVFSAVITVVPTDVVWEGWGREEATSSFSWAGEPLPFVPYVGMAEEFQKAEPDMRGAHDRGYAAFPDKVVEAKIDVGSIKSPLFMIAGDADEVWDSGCMARNIQAERSAQNLETELFVSEDASHKLAGDPSHHNSKANADLLKEAHPAMFDFLQRHLAAD